METTTTRTPEQEEVECSEFEEMYVFQDVHKHLEKSDQKYCIGVLKFVLDVTGYSIENLIDMLDKFTLSQRLRTSVTDDNVTISELLASLFWINDQIQAQRNDVDVKRED
jgi:hypothetical protein